LALDVTVLDEDGNEVPMTESVEEDHDEDIKPLIDGDANFAFGNGESFESAGFTEGTAEELEDADSFGDFAATEEPEFV
jgi:DNA-directed RNA polymerase subunit beta